MKRRELASKDANQYCVWTQSGEMREIKANTAYEAFRGSGLAGVIKIERVSTTLKSVLDKSKFVDVPTPDKKITDANGDVLERIRMHKNPIISAEEMEALMRPPEAPASLPQEETAPPVAETPMVQAAPPSPEAPTTDFTPPPLPDLTDIAAYAGGENPGGVDVHGDGFDEIIPSKIAPVKASQPKEAAAPVPAAEAVQPAVAAELPPEKELSPEEVEKLLSGK